MSHIARCKTQLKNCDREMMKQVIGFLAAKHNGNTITTVKDYYGTENRVDIGLKTQSFDRGIGIVFNQDGTVTFIYDDFNREHEVAELKDEITQTYTAQAVAQALQAMGYTIKAEEINKQIVINGVKEG